MSTHPSVRYALYARTRLEREVLDAIVALHCHPRDTWLCEDLASAVARAGAGKAEILIADVSVDDAMALDHCLQALSRGGQDARVILIISDTASNKEFRPLLEHADGLMTREEGAAVLSDAVACVLAGGTYTSSRAERLLNTSGEGIAKLGQEKAPERHQKARCVPAGGVGTSRETREPRIARGAPCSDQQAVEVMF